MFFALLVSFALWQAVQQPAPQMGTAKPLTDEKVEKCTIEGKVTSAVDGMPLKKAIVSLMPQSQPGTPVRPTSATTDGDGMFVFKDVEAARYTMSVSRNGYARQSYGARSWNAPGTTLALAPGQHLKDINVRLTPGAAISGRIVDEDNDPVAGVQVSGMRWGYMQGRRQLMPFGFSQTDDRGQFRMYGLGPGRYLVSATYHGDGMMMISVGESNPKESQEAYVPTYYPGTSDPAQASAIEVKPGDDILGVVFRLGRTRAVRVSGIVRGTDGQPFRNAMIQLFPRSRGVFSGMDMQLRMTDDKGTFTFTGVMPGAYVAFVRGALDQQQAFGRADVEVGSSPIDNVIIQAGSGAELDVSVHLDGAVDLSSSTVRLYLASEEMLPLPSSSVQIKEEGKATLSKVYDGSYNLRAGGLPGDAYISKATFDEKDALNEPLKIRGGGGPLDITISGAGAHMEGSVLDKDHQPVSGAQVVLAPDESRRSRLDLFRTASSDQYGHYVLRGIPPGTYKLFAWEAIDPGAYQDPEFLKAYEGDGKTIQLGAGERSSPELKLIPSAKTGS